jgi:hypothetical protein
MDSPWKIPPGYFGTGPENIKIIKNFIDQDDVKQIYKFAKTINEWLADGAEDIYNEDGVCTYSAWYWKDRQCSSEILQRISPEIYDLVDFYIDKMGALAGEFFNCKLEKRPPCIIRWFAGIEQQPHADKQLLDGSPNPFKEYDVNSLFYYNDDFEGGELYYPDFDIVVKPEPGLAVIHPGDIHYLHGVKMITAGERFTTPAFYTVKD